MTEAQQKTVEFLEGLVYGRESMKSLNEKLSKHFGEKIEVSNTSKSRLEGGDDDEGVDWNLLFGSNKKETFGYFDIYMLPMRRKGFDDADMYITEIAWEFE